MSPVHVSNSMGNFLLYLSGSARAAEWNSPDLPRQWGITNKEDGVMWSKTSDSFSKRDRTIVLDAFNLLAWAAEFPLETLKVTSPAELIKFRRQKEEELGLRPHQVFRDGVTHPEDHPAEIYD